MRITLLGEKVIHNNHLPLVTYLVKWEQQMLGIHRIYLVPHHQRNLVLVKQVQCLVSLNQVLRYLHRKVRLERRLLQVHRFRLIQLRIKHRLAHRLLNRLGPQQHPQVSIFNIKYSENSGAML